MASLIPSGTEIVSALGMADTLVGRSHGCDYPPEVRDLPVLSRPKVDPSLRGEEIDAGVRSILGAGDSLYEILRDALLAAAPDVVITQDHCDACAVSLGDVRTAVACAELAGASICALHPHDLAAVTDDFHRVADALAVPERGDRLARRFAARLMALRGATRGRHRPRVVLIEWLDPPMVAGGWIPELARTAGLDPLVVEKPSSFVQVSWDELERKRPDAVVVLPCGFGVGRTLDEIAGGSAREPLGRWAARLPLGCWIVDGDAYFNRPGPRLADSAEILAAIFHPASAPTRPEHAGAFRRLAPDAPAQRTISVPSGIS